MTPRKPNPLACPPMGDLRICAREDCSRAFRVRTMNSRQKYCTSHCAQLVQKRKWLQAHTLDAETAALLKDLGR